MAATSALCARAVKWLALATLLTARIAERHSSLRGYRRGACKRPPPSDRVSAAHVLIRWLSTLKSSSCTGRRGDGGSMWFQQLDVRRGSRCDLGSSQQSLPRAAEASRGPAEHRPPSAACACAQASQTSSRRYGGRRLLEGRQEGRTLSGLVRPSCTSPPRTPTRATQATALYAPRGVGLPAGPGRQRQPRVRTDRVREWQVGAEPAAARWKPTAAYVEKLCGSVGRRCGREE